MLAHFHQKFWVTGGANALCRKIINKCVICRRRNAKVQSQKMADLPKDRVLPEKPPFSNVGMDYFGPFEVKVGRSLVKRYGVLFTCLTTRAIHLEVANSLTTDSCINSIRRFVSRRGQVDEIRSDNGTNLVGAERELRAELKKWNQSTIQNACLQKGITWIFNPPAGSHFGGVWERQVRTVRKILNSVIREQVLTDESLSTLMCEVEAIVNGRPLTKVTEDLQDVEALTPNHLLLMKGKPVLPPTLTDSKDHYVKRRWRQVQYLSDIFWRRWIREYLPLLQERQKWNQLRPNVKEGDVVLLMDNSQPRGSWPMGRITKTMPDDQGQVRSIQVKTKTGVYIRPISKVIMLLECDDAPANPVTSRDKSDQLQHEETNSDTILTRVGRQVKPRERLDL